MARYTLDIREWNEYCYINPGEEEVTDASGFVWREGVWEADLEIEPTLAFFKLLGILHEDVSTVRLNVWIDDFEYEAWEEVLIDEDNLMTH